MAAAGRAELARLRQPRYHVKWRNDSQACVRSRGRILQYKAGYKFVPGAVHAQVLDFPAAITCGGTLDEARALLAVALIDVAETLVEGGQPLLMPNPQCTNTEMDIEQPIYLHLKAGSAVEEVPAGVVTP